MKTYFKLSSSDIFTQSVKRYGNDASPGTDTNYFLYEHTIYEGR